MLMQQTHSRSLGQLRYTMTVRDGYAVIHHTGAPRSPAVAQAWERSIEEFLRRHDLAKVVWDSRDAAPNPPAVRSHLWRWLGDAQVLKVSAFVVNNDNDKPRTYGRMLDLKSFSDLEEACVWIQQIPLPPPTPAPKHTLRGSLA